MDRRVAEARLNQVLCGKYTLESVLGVGGMATVYRATHRNGHKAAVKILHPHLAAYEGIRERFLKEAYTANRLEHPGAVCITDDDVAEDGAAFLVMELLDGETLDSWAERCGPALPPAEVARAMHEVLDVLVAAHRHGVIHRDLKPENVFRNRDGRIKVLDFGIARAIFDSAPSQTRTGSLLGTPAYMPPEQACGRIREIDGRTDLWAVGATAFCLLAGRTVHSQDTVELLHVAAATQPAPPIASVARNIPSPIAAVFDCALAFDKSARWANAREMQAALEDAYLISFGQSLVTRDEAALQATLLPESRRRAAVPCAETMPPSLAPASMVGAPPGTQRMGTPPTAGLRDAHLPVGASTTGAVVSERSGAIHVRAAESIPVPPSATVSRQRSVVAAAIGLGLLAIVGVSVLRSFGNDTTSSAAAAPPAAFALVPSSTATAAPDQPAPGPDTKDEGRAATTDAGPIAPIRSADPKPRPLPRPKPPPAPVVVPSAPPPPPPPAPQPPSCNPPFRIEGGIKINKPECSAAQR